MSKSIFIVTAAGENIDTEVYIENSFEDAWRKMDSLRKEFIIYLNYFKTLRENVFMGYSWKVKCNVKIQIHKKTLQYKEGE